METGSQVIFKDVLNFLEIKNIVFDFENGKTSSLQIERISEKEFICFSSSPIVPLGTLIIETDSGFFPVKCFAHSLSYSYYIGEYRIEFLETLPKFLIKKIREYNALIKKSNRRSEERYDVGLKKWQDFLLERADQRLIMSYNFKNRKHKVHFNKRFLSWSIAHGRKFKAEGKRKRSLSSHAFYKPHGNRHSACCNLPHRKPHEGTFKIFTEVYRTLFFKLAEKN